MRLQVDKSKMKLTPMPDGADGTKCVKAYLGDHKVTFYLNLEPGEIDYTGYARNRGGIGYRMHLVRNGGLAPRTIVLELQDDPLEQDYKILMICLDERGLPLKNRVNETYRVPHIVFDNAADCAEYEDYLVQTYDAETRPRYDIRSWEEGTPIETKWAHPDEGVTSLELGVASPYKDWNNDFPVTTLEDM